MTIQYIAGIGCALILGGVPAGLRALDPTMAQASADWQTADRQHLMTDTFQEYRSVRRIPKAVRDAMAAQGAMSVADEGSRRVFRMADPGQPYQAGDAIQNPRLPWARLIFAAVSRNYCFLEYESGGIAHFLHARLYRLDGKKAVVVREFHIRQTYTNLTDFRKSLSAGQID